MPRRKGERKPFPQHLPFSLAPASHGWKKGGREIPSKANFFLKSSGGLGWWLLRRQVQGNWLFCERDQKNPNLRSFPKLCSSRFLKEKCQGNARRCTNAQGCCGEIGEKTLPSCTEPGSNSPCENGL